MRSPARASSAVVGRTPERFSREISPEERRSLAVQALLGRLAFPVIGPAAVFFMRRIRRNRIVGLGEARRIYRQALATGRPTLVCANHLTMYDSMFLHDAFGSTFDYLVDFRSFSWNVPAVENFAKTPLWRTLVYLGKCIPIDRAGTEAHHKEVLSKITYLVGEGQVATIFPEGGRSRTGQVDVEAVTYGIGRILSGLRRPQVVCAYLRGERQETFGHSPEKGDVLHLRVEVIEPATDHTGLRGVRDLSRQVIGKLREMEEAYFQSGAAGAPRD
jgi:1-acyl-sn-glycerol-3-phosphate acyltransferase